MVQKNDPRTSDVRGVFGGNFTLIINYSYDAHKWAVLENFYSSLYTYSTFIRVG